MSDYRETNEPCMKKEIRFILCILCSVPVVHWKMFFFLIIVSVNLM